MRRPYPKRPLMDRFIENLLVMPNNCWEWTGSSNRDGYGIFAINGKNKLAHRIGYEFFHKPIPAGLTIDHLCRNRKCVNPRHLEPVSNRENLRRGEGFVGVNSRKTHCPEGHAYDEANTYRDAKGMRHCRACGAANARRYRERQKAAAG